MFENNYGPYLPQDRDCRALDIGCGSGRMLAYLHEKGYRNLRGIDVDPNVLALAPAHVRSYLQHISDLSQFLRDNKAQFDLIIAKDVLYYFPRHEALQRMREISDALCPGGMIIAEVFNAALLTAGYTAAKDVGIQTMYSEQSLRSLLEAAGLDVAVVRGAVLGQGRWRRPFYALAASLWRMVTKLIYLLERGVDSQNPKILAKSILAVARRPG
ncbi:class I SAM-dependent methyltransferase [Dokdonella soli]|uniref:Class I SAM-dependent methyltransferase n=1 Tax=Dokdonella soli TaxID=529810 RepID=A0ABP3TJ72_9GAMM